ncbi:uncharacterized protein LY89DRAFT_631812 [Mollisia scopiformis]|uniref:N-acetyltransferase domain-containing protein n=1 Tax=Mollisia scopiformis TaxID=149040 RepID=A0A132B4A9_MOLSC|nr:uncharacterized protein LY89DRAFT_631812 [Mollisia scopiformis]KUJ07232.1 hypothetical protein LY89DRAFT_631812 [Mollisia scopiformis]
MGSTARSASTKVVLVPWDPDSRAHAERMVQQRIACGWHQDTVPKWQIRQREGKKNLQWIVIHVEDANCEDYLAKHLTAHPQESTTLVDTAASLGGKTRQPDSTVEFVPVGHISLDTEYESPEYNDPSPGTYFISTFYVSQALQGSGIGRGAMDIVEKTAISEPLCAKRLALSTTDKDDPLRVAKHAAYGKPVPKVTNQDWYERRGYEIYRKVENMWSEVDPTGKIWQAPAVFMRKEITS